MVEMDIDQVLISLENSLRSISEDSKELRKDVKDIKSELSTLSLRVVGTEKDLERIIIDHMHMNTTYKESLEQLWQEIRRNLANNEIDATKCQTEQEKKIRTVSVEMEKAIIKAEERVIDKMSLKIYGTMFATFMTVAMFILSKIFK